MQAVSRRQALRQLSLITAGLAVACTPLRVLTHAYPAAFDDDPELLDEPRRALYVGEQERDSPGWEVGRVGNCHRPVSLQAAARLMPQSDCCCRSSDPKWPDSLCFGRTHPTVCL